LLRLPKSNMLKFLLCCSALWDVLCHKALTVVLPVPITTANLHSLRQKRYLTNGSLSRKWFFFQFPTRLETDEDKSEKSSKMPSFWRILNKPHQEKVNVYRCVDDTYSV
jgi:hypothetical protein